jgi:cellulose/xylan binding protein with CBM9 domain
MVKINLYLIFVFMLLSARGNEANDDILFINKIKPLYKTGKGTPAELKTDMLAARSYSQAFRVVLDQEKTLNKSQSREKLKKLQAEIEKGLKWPVQKREKVKIPYLKSCLKINGKLDEPAWNKALTFSGQYHTGETKQAPGAAEWKVMWDNNFLYFGAKFEDHDLQANKEKVYYGDSLEIFVMPIKRLRTYWEIIVSPSGKMFDGMHVNNHYGGFIFQNSKNIKGLRFAVAYSGTLNDGKNDDKFFSVEVAIPFSELPGYMRGNRPKCGETIFFMLVRTDKNEGNNVEFLAVRPLLYGGHNIFGYIQGELVGSIPPSSINKMNILKKRTIIQKKE